MVEYIKNHKKGFTFYTKNNDLRSLGNRNSESLIKIRPAVLIDMQVNINTLGVGITEFCLHKG